MLSSLHQRFTRAESAFLDALASGVDAITSFENEYSLLCNDLQSACAEGSVDPETAKYAYTVSSRIAHVAGSFRHFNDSCNELTSQVTDAYSKNHDLVNEKSSASSRRDVSLAAHWLACNYRNPYPSNAVRDRISQQASWNRKDVDAWFTDARRRMGWNDIKKHFCSNKRAGAVQKASEFFESHQCLSNPALESAFTQMSRRVHELFVEPFG